MARRRDGRADPLRPGICRGRCAARTSRRSSRRSPPSTAVRRAIGRGEARLEAVDRVRPHPGRSPWWARRSPHPGPDLGAARGAARARRAGAPPPIAGLRRGVRGRAGAAAGGLPDRERGAPPHLVGHRRLRVGGRQPALARRARARGLTGRVRRALAGDGARVRLRRRSARLRVGGEPPCRRPPRARSTRAAPRPSSSSTRRRRPASSTSSRCSPCRDAGALSIVDAVSSLGAVPLETDAWGRRRRRDRLAEGPA